MAQIQVWNRSVYDLIGTPFCCLLGFRKKVTLGSSPLNLSGGDILRPGDLVKSIRGDNTSADYSQIEMVNGSSLRYEGSYTDQDGTMVCFSQVRNEQLLPIQFNDYPQAYWGFQLRPSGDFQFITASESIRIVETKYVEFYEEAGHENVA